HRRPLRLHRPDGGAAGRRRGRHPSVPRPGALDPARPQVSGGPLGGVAHPLGRVMSRYDDIHVVAGAVLRRYQARRKQVLELNARLMRFDDWLPAHGVPRVEPFVDAWDFVAFHSFQPGFAPFSADDLLHLGELEAGLDAGASPGRAALERRLEAAGWL